MLLDVFAVFINANGEEGDDDCRRAEISAVTVAVFYDVRQSGHGDGHRQNDDKRGHDRAARGGGLYAAEYRKLFKAGNKAEDGRDAGRDQAQEQACAVDNGQCADAHCIAGRERWNGRAAVN